MIVYIACAKIMSGHSMQPLPFTTEPLFQPQANRMALQMASYTVRELQTALKVNRSIAQTTWQRYQQFFQTEKKREAAAFSYDGMVFKKLAPETFSEKDLRYANEHLFIGSFLYGLLRPLDVVMSYRMEGRLLLPENGKTNLFDFWKPLLTDYLIEQIKADDGILVNLASNEMTTLFDWKRVLREVRVVTPEFQVLKEDGLKTIVIYTKMCRGAMARFILKNRITSLEALKSFEYDGFSLDESSGDYHFNLL
ncbi:MAG: YaaA family protein [Bacteroidaceae bacterium]